MKQYIYKRIKNAPVKRRRPPTKLGWLYFSIILASIIAYGFISAARYHFQAIDLGYQSEILKQQRAQLELSQRKLTLELARRTAPQKLDLRAQKQGLALPSVNQTLLLRRTQSPNRD